MSEVSMNLSQRGVWMGQQLLGNEVTASNMAFASYWNMPIAEDAFTQAFHELVKECDNMRMVVNTDSQNPCLSVLPTLNFELPVIPLPQHLTNASREALYNYFSSLAAQPLDVEKRLFNAILFRASPQRYILFWVQYHLITDGWGFALQQRRLWDKYQLNIGNKTVSTDSISSYFNYLDHFEDRFASSSSSKTEYWESIVDQLPPPPQFYGRSNPSLSAKSSAYLQLIPKETCERIKALLLQKEFRLFSFELGLLTLFTSLTLAFAYRLSGQKKQSIGLPFHNRLTADDRLVPGLLMEIFPLIAQIKPADSFQDFYHQVKDQLIATMRHAQPNLSPIDASRQLVTYFNLVGQSMDFSQEGLLNHDWLDPGFGEPNYHLAAKLYDFDSSGQWTLRIDLNHEIFPEDVRPLIIPQYLELLDALLDDPTQFLDVVTTATVDRVKSFQRSFQNENYHFTIVDYIHQQAKKTPHQEALKFKNETISFQELDEATNQIANYFSSKGLSNGDVIGICTQRSADQIKVLLGILKAGAAYVPLDPEHPTERLDFLLKDSAAKMLIYGDDLANRFSYFPKLHLSQNDLFEISTHHPKSPPKAFPKPSDLIYIYYTSGSTGLPKGVMVQHDGVLNLIHWTRRQFPSSSNSKFILYKTVLGFDSAPWEFFSNLISGDCCCIAEHDKGTDPLYLEQVTEENELETCYFVTPLLQDFVHNNGKLSGVKHLVSGGDELRPALVRDIYHKYPKLNFYNIYGPTEASITTTFYPFKREEMTTIREIPIGYPVDNVYSIICDPNGKLCPVGVSGELYIGGIQVARGYLNRPTLTAQKFISHSPYPDSPPIRFFRTGDLARWRADGAIIFQGRIDNQVKIRGIRLEPDGIEKVLRQAPGVAEALILVHSSESGEKSLVAYIQRTGHATYNPETTRAFLADRLPSVMQPKYIIDLAKFPLLANGKIDRKNLPKPSSRPTIQIKSAPPRNEFEELVYSAWKSFFPNIEFGVLHSFFDLNGQSLVAIRLINEINNQFSLNLPANTLFKFPTPASLAKHIESVIRALMAAEDQES